ncbi:hypothetical protein ACKWTF_016200 [Chironomus riparius]
MNKTLFVMLILIKNCICYDYPKPEIKFDCEDTPPNLVKHKVARGVFFYTYDDNYDGRKVEMHELNPETFNKLISSKDYVKTPAALKSTFHLLAFFDGQCETSIKCERIQQECLKISPCSKSSTTTKLSTTTTTKPPTASKAPTTTTIAPEPPSNEIEQKISKIFLDGAPQLTKLQLDEIMTALKKMGKYSQNWTASQNYEITTRSSLINQREMLKQNTSANAVIKFSDEIKQHIINYTKEFDPDMSLEDILGMISVVEEIGTATMRYLTVDQFIALNSKVVSQLVNVEDVFVTTSKAPKITKRPKISATTTTKSPTTFTIATTTQKPASTTKTYIPPPGSSRKPYTHWAGTYRQYSGYYSFGYTWKPFTGGYSWRSRRYTSGTTTTTKRYKQRSVIKQLNPIINTE